MNGPKKLDGPGTIDSTLAITGGIYRFSIHKAIIIVFAFLNPLFLPFGLFYTHIYALISLRYVLKWSRRATLFLSLLVILAIIYSIVIISIGREIRYTDYLISFFILFASLIFSVYVYLYIALRISDFEKLVEKVIKLNFFISMIALVLLIAGFGDTLWTSHGAVGKANRLQLFFYEPSIYALVSSPFITYAITSYFEKQSARRTFLLLLALIPLLLSGSAGVIGALSLAVILGNIRLALKIFLKKWPAILLVIAVSTFALPNLINRYQLIVTGEDNSGAVRVFYSLTAAANLLEEKEMWLLGVGPGQIKYEIEDYTSEIAGFGGVRLPNSVASNIATVGVVGLLLKLLTLFVLYIKTKSYNFRYSNTLFMFVFIYQFTGGYFNNINEYVALAFAFGYSIYRQRMTCAGITCNPPFKSGQA